MQCRLLPLTTEDHQQQFYTAASSNQVIGRCKRQKATPHKTRTGQSQTTVNPLRPDMEQVPCSSHAYTYDWKESTSTAIQYCIYLHSAAN